MVSSSLASWQKNANRWASQFTRDSQLRRSSRAHSMTHPRFTLAKVFAGIAPMLFHCACNAATPQEACKDMTNKLVVIYNLYGYPARFHEDAKAVADPLAAAEQIVSGAYGATKYSLNKKWPGFFDWSALEVLKALERSQSPAAFHLTSLSNCLSRYG